MPANDTEQNTEHTIIDACILQIMQAALIEKWWACSATQIGSPSSTKTNHFSSKKEIQHLDSAVNLQ